MCIVTTSDETEGLDHPVLRQLVSSAREMSLADRITLLKGLIPAVAKDMNPRDFAGLIAELRMKGERFHDATSHPGEGRRARHVMGERDVEGR
jgi:hypothetical protein